MRESINIINQAMSKITDGPVKIDNQKIVSPSKTYNEVLYGRSNTIILNYNSEGFHVPSG
jgi:NADH:ubiquinone oxidoreductase subunit D